LIAVLTLSLGSPGWSIAESRSDKPANESRGEKWIPLFDGNTLNGWYTNLRGHKKNEDPSKVFHVHDGVIHAYKDQAVGDRVTFGCLVTDAEFSHYHLRLQYKWGEKKFKPREQQRRDAGLLYHVVGPDVVWPRCFECQIQENDVGDLFAVRGAEVLASVEQAKLETPRGFKMFPRFKPEADGGKMQRVGEGPTARIVKSSTHEHEGWNTVEVIVEGANGATHIVNGHPVFQASELRQLTSDSNSSEPLSHGRIAIQAEFAEVYYRNIEIRPLKKGRLHAPSQGKE
jgi:hypothetical protein